MTTKLPLPNIGDVVLDYDKKQTDRINETYSAYTDGDWIIEILGKNFVRMSTRLVFKYTNGNRVANLPMAVDRYTAVARVENYYTVSRNLTMAYSMDENNTIKLFATNPTNGAINTDDLQLSVSVLGRII